MPATTGPAPGRWQRGERARRREGELQRLAFRVSLPTARSWCVCELGDTGNFEMSRSTARAARKAAADRRRRRGNSRGRRRPRVQVFRRARLRQPQPARIGGNDRRRFPGHARLQMPDAPMVFNAADGNKLRTRPAVDKFRTRSFSRVQRGAVPGERSDTTMGTELRKPHALGAPLAWMARCSSPAAVAARRGVRAPGRQAESVVKMARSTSSARASRSRWA